MNYLMPLKRHVPDPRVTESEVSAFAHCGQVIRNELCPGNAQERVQAVRTLREETFASRGGGDDPGAIGNLYLNFVENSYESLRFADPADMPCPHCGNPRELSAQERLDYPVLIGGADALLRTKQVGAVIQPERAQAIAAGAPETPLELLQRRYISGEIESLEFSEKRAVLFGEPMPAAPEPEGGESAPAADLPAGIRLKPNGRYQAVWRDDSGQHGPTFDTLDEAIAAREAALAEREEG